MKKRRRGKQKMEHVPCRLREIRKAQGKSVVGLAHEAGLHPEHLRAIEGGRVTGHLSIHLKLAKALGVSMDQYLGFGAFDLVSGERPELVKSNSSLIVEKLPPSPDTALGIQRIQIAPHKECDLTGYLGSEKPSFFYMVQGGEAKVWIYEKAHSLTSGEHFWLPRPVKLRMENPGALPLVFLMIQP